MALTSPIVVAPISPCSRFVRVQNQSAGATVEVFATDPVAPTTRRVGKKVVASANELVELTPGIRLEPGEFVTASQRIDTEFADHLSYEFGVEVSKEPELADLDALFSAETLLECGTCLWIAGVWPGAVVTLRQNQAPPLTADSAGDMVKFVLPAGQRLHANDTLSASQTACGLAGGSVTLLQPMTQVRTDWPVAGPTIAEPLARCQRYLELSNVLPGSTVVVGLDGTDHSACFGARQGTFWLPRELRVGDVVSVRQEFPLCELRSKLTEGKVAASRPPCPSIVAPICEGDRLVEVTGLYVNASVEFAANGVALCRGTAAAGNTPFGVPSLVNVTRLQVRQSICGAGDEAWSDWSESVPVRLLGPQASPAIVEPLFARGVAVRVTRGPWPSATLPAPFIPEPLDKGSLVQVVSQRGVLGQAWTNGDAFVDVPLWFPLRQSDRVHVRTRRCGHLHDWPHQSAVGNASDLMRPRVADPACDCGGSVLVHSVVPGAIVDVFRSRGGGGPALIGTTRAGFLNVSVDVSPLAAGDQVQARQRMGPAASALGQTSMSPTLPHWGYFLGSAHRLCQLTQDSDPTGLPHPGPTTPIGVAGTDLGIPVEHAGRMYLFFGDAAEAPGITTDADPIAWLTTSNADDLETTAPDLQWVLGGGGKFRRLTLSHGPELGNFQVPTGAFSYDGRLYVFVATKPSEAEPPMTESRLVVASDPAEDFTPIQYISSTVGGQTLTRGPDGSLTAIPYPGGRWMLHISPTVIRNADWPGLPSASGDGLLMFGSSVYRGKDKSLLTPEETTRSNVYLAWAPLTSGVVPPKSPLPGAQDWHFFTGLDGLGNPVWHTLAGNFRPALLLLADPADPNDPAGVVDPTGAFVLPRGVGEISVVWNPTLRRWILLGSEAAPANMARSPWGPWTTSRQICNAALAGLDAGNLQAGGHWAGYADITYAPYVIGRWSRWDRSIRHTTVYFTLSLFDLPNNQARYQPQLMRSTIDCWS